jgi:membrane-associated phospholipid phosphatase
MPYFFVFLVYLITFFYLDKSLADLLGKPFHNLQIFKIMSFSIAPITHLIASLVFTLAAICLKKKAFLKLSSTYLINVLIFMFVIGVLKIAFGRARPLYYLDSNFYGFSFLGGLKSAFRSFPSSHAASAFAIFHYLLELKIIKMKKLTAFFCTLLVTSRIFLCEHYISDLILGSFIGWHSTSLAYYFQKKSSKLFTCSKLI